MYSYCYETNYYKCHYCGLKIYKKLKNIILCRKELFFHDECFILFKHKVLNELNIY